MESIYCISSTLVTFNVTQSSQHWTTKISNHHFWKCSHQLKTVIGKCSQTKNTTLGNAYNAGKHRAQFDEHSQHTHNIAITPTNVHSVNTQMLTTLGNAHNTEKHC